MAVVALIFEYVKERKKMSTFLLRKEFNYFEEKLIGKNGV